MNGYRAKDEAGNYTGEETTTIGVPTNYTFVVNAVPKVASAARTARSVWASRVTVEMPAAAGQPGDAFVLLPEHAGLSDPDLVPVTIHAVDSPTPVGANTIVADGLGVPGIITETIRGWAVVLPSSIPPGGTAEYDIVWGKIAYFGWQELVDVPRCLPNYQRHGSWQNPPDWFSSIEGATLDDDLRMWRLASRRHSPDTWGDSGWLMMSVANEFSCVFPERFIRFDRGTPWDGAYGDRYDFDSGGVISCGAYIVPMWMEMKQTRVGDGGFVYMRYGLEVYDSSGQVINAYDSEYIEDTWIDFPRDAIHDRVYITGDTSFPDEELWYAAYDCTGNEVIARTACESATGPKSLSAEPAYRCGPNVILLWRETWSTPEGDDRGNVRYQVRTLNDAVVVPPTTLNPPLFPDPVEEDDQWWISNILVDQEGKVWIGLEHDLPWPTSDEYFYIIIGVDGQIWKPLTSVPEIRYFLHCDRDGYVWARQGGNLLILNPDDTAAEPPRPTAFVPTQHLGQIEVARDYYGDSYRLYDRWSSQYVAIDVPPEANSDTMDMFDLNLWSNGLHPANITLDINGSPVPFPPGPFTGHTTVDVSGLLGEGMNLLTTTQDDFLGGQVLVTFPYIECFSDQRCDDGIDCTDDACVDGFCTHTDNCAEGALCNEDTGECVECLEDTDCPQERPICTSNFACVECLDDPDCDDGVACTEDSCNLATKQCNNIPNHDLCTEPPLTHCDPDQGCIEVPTGGCCLWTVRGCLSDLTEDYCVATIHGLYAGDNTECPEACHRGACCSPEGSCGFSIETHCVDSNGEWQGPGTECDPSPCTGACCLPDGSCAPDQTAADCAAGGGDWQGLWSECEPIPCTGACCFPDGSCEADKTTDDCDNAGGQWLGDGTTCEDCPPPGACCSGDGSCDDITEEACCGSGGVAWGGEGSSCDTYICVGACCLAGDCVPGQSKDNCSSVSGVWAGPGMSCDPDPCVGACCIDTTTCVPNQSEANCDSVTDEWAGFFTECPLDDEDLCPICDDGDVDRDGDVDLRDFATFQTCLTCFDVFPFVRNCKCVDMDNDIDIDLDDYAEFRAGLTGP